MSLPAVSTESIKTILSCLDEESAQKFLEVISQDPAIQRIFNNATTWQSLHKRAPRGSYPDIKLVHDCASYCRDLQKEICKAAFNL